MQEDQRHQLEPLVEALQRKTTVYNSLYEWPYHQNLPPVGKGGYVSQPKSGVIDLDSDEETTLEDNKSKETAPLKNSSNVAHNWGVEDLEMPDYNEEMPGKSKDEITGDGVDDDVEEIEDPSDSITLASFIKPKPPSHTPPVPQWQVRESGETRKQLIVHEGLVIDYFIHENCHLGVSSLICFVIVSCIIFFPNSKGYSGKLNHLLLEFS